MFKRAFDIAVSTFFLFPFFPFYLLIAALIKLDSRGPILHRAQRIGKDGQPFTLYKFRTMVADAAQRGPGITQGNDPRVTRVGRFLRKLKIDEMPQLINVLKGEMSIVGPRPEDPRYVTHYTAEQRRVFTVRPGMASPAFIKYRHEEELLALWNRTGNIDHLPTGYSTRQAAAGDDLEHVYLTQMLPDKLRLDLDYIEHQSFLGDLAILAQAALSLFTTADRGRQTAARSLREASELYETNLPF